MNSKNIVPIEFKEICWKCLEKKDNIKKIIIPPLRYGSYFDSFGTEIQLCKECYDKSSDIWELNYIEENGNRVYQYEKEIFEYIYLLPIDTQELFFNTCAWGYNADKMKRQDWIDYKLNELSFEKCKEYNLLHIDELKAYMDRFPKCQHVIYTDDFEGGILCKCPFNTYGEKEQKCKTSYTSPNCYDCIAYKERTTPIKTIAKEDYADYKIYFFYNLDKDNLENKFG